MQSTDRSAKPSGKRKPLVKILGNLTFVLAQHLTAVIQSKISFSFDQSQRRIYLIHPIISLIEQLKISSNQKQRSKADGMKVRFPTV